jgi:hypothetical protein
MLTQAVIDQVKHSGFVASPGYFFAERKTPL